ncbi:MAG: putative metal-binding motif-containing protein, partial [Patescibacteria group bacterium]
MRQFKLVLAVAAVAISGCESMFPAVDFKSVASTDSSISSSADSGPAPCQIKTWFIDSDADGHGDPAKFLDACSAPAGYVASNDDCNDAAKTVHPGASESCNNVDDNCNKIVDDTKQSWWLDADKDGFGNAKFEHVGPCTGVESFFVANNTDCNDNVAIINPVMKETCNTPGVDDNCNGQTDEGQLSEFHADVDGDGHGSSDPKKNVFACAPSKEAVVSNDDCDDTDAKNFPGNP